jgi:16S rRNA (adenine1518-N6/adenine1519-N6)-dimethyltransferase
VIAAAGLDARKSLGQHFLLDPNLLARIVREVPMAPGDRVLEIGPGPGGLTRALLDAGAEVVAIERDSRAMPALEALGRHHPGRLTLIEGDALRVDHARLAGAGAHIAANLPYNIGTELLVRWLTLEPWPPWWRSATLMFQKEVAERIVAPTGSPAYGRLAVLAALRTRARIALSLPPRAFVPPPRVDSAVVTLVPMSMAAGVPLARVEELTAAAFGQRRKMLRQSLKAVPQALEALARAAIDPARRPETLSPADFAEAARWLTHLRAGARSGPADS